QRSRNSAVADARATGSASTDRSRESASRNAAAPSPPSRSSPPPGQPVRMSASAASVGLDASIAADKAPAPDRTEPSMSKAAARASSASAARMAPALRLSRYAGAGVAAKGIGGGARTASSRGRIADGDHGRRLERVGRGQAVLGSGPAREGAVLDERRGGWIRGRGRAQRHGERLAGGRVTHVSQDL